MARRLTKIVQVRFSQTDLDSLKRLAAKSGTCLSAMIRMAMMEKLASVPKRK